MKPGGDTMNRETLHQTEAKRWIRFLVFFLALAGVLIEIVTTRLTREIWFLFRFYTIQTNLLVAFSMLLWLFIRDEKRRYAGIVRLFSNAVALWILITGILYGLLLAGFYHPTGWKSLSNLLMHYVTPLAMVIHELIFSKPIVSVWWLPAVWVSYPLIYSGVSVLSGLQNGFFPYWFLNPTQNYPQGAGSLLNVGLFVGAMMIVFVSFGFLMLRFNRRWTREDAS